jgi:hypothetical protein
MTHRLIPGHYSPLRWPAALFLLVNAGIHLYLTPMHLVEAPYIGFSFIALSAACIVLAGLLLFRDAPIVWIACGLVSLLGLVAFLLSRTIGLPQIQDDVGNWSDPLGYPTIVVETLTVITAAATRTRSMSAGRAATRSLVR